ncbi:MAG: hypothetical protein IPK76_14740 [Lewinellaceae bacterium]|nr:hypothetical protein [Lewinellaceae bacterium]
MKAIVHREEDRTKAVILSLIFHALILALLIFYRFAAPAVEDEIIPPILIELGGGGDNAAAGEPDRGQGNNPAPQGQQMEDPTSTEVAEVPVPQPKPVPPSTPPPAQSKPSAPNIATTEDPNVAALKRAQEETKRKQQQEQDRIRRQQEEQRRIAAEQERVRQEAAAKAQREKQEREAQKGKFGSTFGNGSGSGQGNTGKPGNQGIPTGTGDNPFGKSPGTGGGTGGGDGTGAGGSVGGGLGGRKVVKKVAAKDNSQKQGTVRIKVCVNGDGKVISADPTQSGSTTTDGQLRAAATTAAFQWKFESSPGADTQCGWIDFNFILK